MWVTRLKIKHNCIIGNRCEKFGITTIESVFVDKQGYEFWEVASWKKSILTEFITGIIKEVTKNIEVQKIEQTKLTDIYFSQLMPNLTKNQKRAIMLAFEHGYYAWPKRTDFGKLAKLMGISIPTFREHLKRAEEKLMPDLIRSII